MQNQGHFKLCASSTDIVKNFAVTKSVVIKRGHCTKFDQNPQINSQDIEHKQSSDVDQGP